MVNHLYRVPLRKLNSCMFDSSTLQKNINIKYKINLLLISSWHKSCYYIFIGINFRVIRASGLSLAIIRRFCMNVKKALLYLLLSIFLVIFAYNYILVPMLYQTNTGMGMMGMGMHRGQYTNNYYNNYIAYIIIIIIFIIIGLIVVDGIFANTQVNKCKKCGMEIENDKWKVCPYCGNSLRRDRE